MKTLKLSLIGVMLVMSGLMLSANSSCQVSGTCHLNSTCHNTWQCYGDSLSDCRQAANDAGFDERTDPVGYWNKVGQCQSGFCS